MSALQRARGKQQPRIDPILKLPLSVIEISIDEIVN